MWLKLRLVATAVHPRKPFFCRGQPWPAAAQAKTTPNQAPRAACPCGATEPSRHRWWWTGWPCWGAAPGTLLGSPFPSWKRCAQRAPLPPFTLFRTGCFLAGHSRTSVPVTRWAGPKGNNLPKFNKFNAACIFSAQQVTVSPWGMYGPFSCSVLCGVRTLALPIAWGRGKAGGCFVGGPAHRAGVPWGRSALEGQAAVTVVLHSASAFLALYGAAALHHFCVARARRWHLSTRGLGRGHPYPCGGAPPLPLLRHGPSNQKSPTNSQNEHFFLNGEGPHYTGVRVSPGTPQQKPPGLPPCTPPKPRHLQPELDEPP